MLSDAELLCLAAARHLLGIASERRWIRYAREHLAGQSFAGPAEIETAAALATAQLNTRAKPWIWGRPAPPTRALRRRFIYLL